MDNFPFLCKTNDNFPKERLSQRKVLRSLRSTRGEAELYEVKRKKNSACEEERRSIRPYVEFSYAPFGFASGGVKKIYGRAVKKQALFEPLGDPRPKAELNEVSSLVLGEHINF